MLNVKILVVLATFLISMLMIGMMGPAAYAPVVRLIYGTRLPEAWHGPLVGGSWAEARRRLGRAQDDPNPEWEAGRRWIAEYWWGQHILLLSGQPCCQDKDTVARKRVITCVADVAPALALSWQPHFAVCQSQFDSGG